MINRLSELTENIRRCNLLGLSVLPILELAFIQQMQHLPLIEEILSQLHCHPIALIEGIQTSGYCLYRTDTTLLEAKVYVIADIESNELTRD